MRTKLLEDPTFVHGKLSEDHKREVCDLLAQFKEPTEIAKILKDLYGVEVSPKAIYYYKSDLKWQPLIQKYREQYSLELNKVPLYHKRVRLEKLQDQLDEIERETATTSHQRSLRRGELRSVLKDARDEVQPMEDKRGDTNILSIQFNSMDDSELLKKREELLKVIQSSPVKEVKKNVEQSIIESKAV
jgi:hypothetical protein